MYMCMVNSDGKTLEILQEDREPFEHETKVPLVGYYEVFNEQHYQEVVWDFTAKKWVGVGEPIPVLEPSPNLTLEERTRLLEEAINTIMEIGGTA